MRVLIQQRNTAKMLDRFIPAKFLESMHSNHCYRSRSQSLAANQVDKLFVQHFDRLERRRERSSKNLRGNAHRRTKSKAKNKILKIIRDGKY